MNLFIFKISTSPLYLFGVLAKYFKYLLYFKSKQEKASDKGKITSN